MRYCAATAVPFNELRECTVATYLTRLSSRYTVFPSSPKTNRREFCTLMRPSDHTAKCYVLLDWWKNGNLKVCLIYRELLLLGI